MRKKGLFSYISAALAMALLVSGCVFDSRISALSDVARDSSSAVIVKVDGSIQKVVLTEGLTTNVNFTLSRPLSSDLSLRYDIASTRNDQSLNFLSTTGTVLIPAGFAGFTFSINALSDGIYEGDEDYSLIFTPLTTGLGLDTQTLPITIVDHDLPPTISMLASTATAAESAGLTFTSVKLNHASKKSIVVAYNFSNGTALGMGVDYSGSNQFVTFAPGETSKTIPFSIVNDTINEAAETFSITLGAITGEASLGSPASTTVTITDNDAAPTISINSPSIAEGTAAGTTTLTFTVTLGSPSGQTATVNYATASGTATSGTDFTAASGTLTFSPGETTKSVDVAITRDSTSESNETFTVTLSSLVNITSAGSTLIGTGTITDDDTLPTLSIASATIGEAAGSVPVTITLSSTSGQTVTVNWATSDGTATSPSDYTASSGTATITVGSTSTTISIPIIDDSTSESTESFSVTLSSPTNATTPGPTSTASISIIDNDIIWLGTSGDGKWSTPSNWSKSAVPVAADVVSFNSSCNTNCNVTIDTSINISGLNTQASYSGTITQAASSALTIGSQGFTMAAGTFAGGSSNITINGAALTINGGSFTSTSGTLKIVNPAVGYATGNAFIVNVSSGFIHNNGLVWFYFSSSNYPKGLVKVVSGNSFNNLQLKCGVETDDMILSSEGSTVTPVVLGTMTLSSAALKGSWDLRGNLLFEADYGGYQGAEDAQLNFSGQGTQTISNPAGVQVPTGTVTINKPTANSKVVMLSAWTLSANQNMTVSSGNVDLMGYMLRIPGTLTLGSSGGMYLNSGILRVNTPATDLSTGSYSSGTIYGGAAP